MTALLRDVTEVGVTKAKSRSEWAAVVKRLDESGTDVRAFAETEGVNARTLSWWRATFRREERAGARAARCSSVRAQRASDEAAVRFARVVVAPPPPTPALRSATAPGVRLEIGRVRIAVPDGFDRETLVAVLALLGVGDPR